VEENEGINCLRTALNVEGERLVIVVSWRSIGKKKSFLPVLVSAHHPLVEPVIARALSVVLEAVQNVSRMEVINPM